MERIEGTNPILSGDHFVTLALKLVRRECANVFLIVGKEYAQRPNVCVLPVSSGRVRGATQIRTTRTSAGHYPRKAKPETRASFRKRDAADAAAPPLHRDPAKIEAEARFSAALLPFHEQPKNLFRAQVLRKAWAFIVHIRFQEIALVLDADRDAPARWGISQGVFEKIRKDALETGLLGGHRPLGFRGNRGGDGKPHAFRFE